MTEIARSPFPSTRRAWMLVLGLFLAAIVSALDRSILTLLVDPVKHDLGISDVQISLLVGLSFALFYAAMGVPMGLLADRVHRVRLLMVGIVVWSSATVLGGIGTSFTAMVISRLFVGLGEATLGPCALSLISDSFTADRRGRPISVHLLGGAVAAGVAAFLVGWVLTVAPRGVFDWLPGLAGAPPWRIAFVVAGLSGFVLVAYLAFQPEPARQGLILTGDKRHGLREVGRYLVDNRRVLWPYFLGFAMFATGGWAVLGWSATMLIRDFGLTAAGVGKLLGTANLIAGTLGALTAGQILTVGRLRASTGAKIGFSAYLPLLALPTAFAGFAPNPTVAVMMLAPIAFVFPLLTTIVLNTLSEIMPNTMRGLSVSLLGVSGSFVGAVLGPLLVALVSQHLLTGPGTLGRAIMMLALPFYLLATVSYLMAQAAFRRALMPGSQSSMAVAVNQR